MITSVDYSGQIGRYLRRIKRVGRVKAKNV